MELSTPLTSLPGVGPARARALARLGLLCAGDLLGFYPRQYEDRSRVTDLRSAPEGASVCVAAMVAEPPRLHRIRKGMELVKARAVDGSGTLHLTFFNQTYVKDALKPGVTYLFYGKIEGSGAVRSMAAPVYEPEGAGRFVGRIMPVYPLTKGLSNHMVAGLVQRVLDACAGRLAETLPGPVRAAHGLVDVQTAHAQIHFPDSLESLEAARRRLTFEELFFLTAGLALLKGRRGAAPAPPLTGGSMAAFRALLPFPLTGAQARVIEECRADLTSGRAMNRLVQGDVGSGKTVVAAACAYLAAKSGLQCAMMVPTEVLATQHHRTLSALLGAAGVEVALLTGSTRAAQRREILAGLEDGRIPVVVGTHALISEGVRFRSLALMIADEQHRFGVGQRAALLGKGAGVHTLVMSATPIPRTLALIVYGDLDVSVIDELPPGRTPVATYVVGEDKRRRMYGFLEKLCAEGRQAYIVCPMVEEGEDETADLKAVTVYTDELRALLPHLRLAFVHGRMKPREKEAVMAAFRDRALDALVSTTVIEVGVDNPNAALMIVENAERFGLSQLHQLRGRVGRGEHPSYCVLISPVRDAEHRARLRTMAATTDGFKIAEEDLKLRGPGDFFGRRQHGLPALKIADWAGDMRLLTEAQGAAAALLARDPALSAAENAPVMAQIRALFADNPDIFN